MLPPGTALVLAGRGRARMRTNTAAERVEGGARGRAVARDAHRLRVALPLRSWLELWCVMPLLSLLQTNVHGPFVRRMPEHVAQAFTYCVCVCR